MIDYLLLLQVTAAKRPKNSALEVDLDFEHNMKPPPAVTEELTASLEDLIKKRIIEVNPKFKRRKLSLYTTFLTHQLNFRFAYSLISISCVCDSDRSLA